MNNRSIPFQLDKLSTYTITGRVTHVQGNTIKVRGLPAVIGQQCAIKLAYSDEMLLAHVVGLVNDEAILFPLGDLEGITLGAEVALLAGQASITVGNHLVGKVIDARGRDLGHSTENMAANNTLSKNTASKDTASEDISSKEILSREMPLLAPAPNPLQRSPIEHIFTTGISAIDGVLTLGVGQRMGIFAKAGSGKSTLLGQLAQGNGSDIVVMALIGERGREVKECVDNSLGELGMNKAIVVVATADRPAMERVQAAYTATAIAEAYRAQGLRVLLLMDSVTRFARALREIGLSAGEVAVRRGYPASVFPALPKLFERAGNDNSGSITAFYTILKEDDEDPIAEEVKSLLDGHIDLSPALAERGHYPAIDVVSSVSRLSSLVATQQHQHLARQLKKLVAHYRELELLIQIGEYQPGNDVQADKAVAAIEGINQFLYRPMSHTVELPILIKEMERLVG